MGCSNAICKDRFLSAWAKPLLVDVLRVFDGFEKFFLNELLPFFRLCSIFTKMPIFGGKITLVFLHHVLLANGDKSKTNYDLGWEIFHPFSLRNMPELATALQPSLDTVPLGGKQPVRFEGWPKWESKISKPAKRWKSSGEIRKFYCGSIFFRLWWQDAFFHWFFFQAKPLEKTPNSLCVMTSLCWSLMVGCRRQDTMSFVVASSLPDYALETLHVWCFDFLCVSVGAVTDYQKSGLSFGKLSQDLIRKFKISPETRFCHLRWTVLKINFYRMLVCIPIDSLRKLYK